MSDLRDYKRRIKRVFELENERPPRIEEISEMALRDDRSLAFLGYPSLTCVEIFLTAPGSRMWREGQTIRLPEKCCFCGRQSEVYLDVEESDGILRGWRKRTVLKNAPHCRGHAGQGQAKLVVIVDAWTRNLTRITLIGLNPDFLLAAAQLNQQGDVFPPWEAFPGYGPYTMGWREGNGEYWLRKVWGPFWDNLSQSGKEEYLNRWNAPDEWRERFSADAGK